MCPFCLVTIGLIKVELMAIWRSAHLLGTGGNVGYRSCCSRVLFAVKLGAQVLPPSLEYDSS
jgi:hypothetical protein